MTDNVFGPGSESPIEVTEDFEIFTEPPKIVVAAADAHTGAMIALVPSDADARRLALKDFEARDQLHLTLVYLGDAKDIPDEARESIITAVKRYAVGSITAKAFAVNVFNPTGDEPALVLGVGNEGGPALEELRSNIFSSVSGIPGFTMAENHSPWIPHLTLAYSDKPHELFDLASKRTGPITFDLIRVAFGGENTDIPLKGEVELNAQLGDTVVAMATPWYMFDQERDVNAPGGGHNLKHYWTRGKGAVEIGWGTDGSFDRCVAKLGKHVKNPQGLCAEYHKAATGEWPAEKGVESTVSGMEELDVTDEATTAAARKRRKNTMSTYSDEPWSGVLAVEGVESGDGRLFGMGSLDWAQLPLPLMYQPANIGGHQASIMVGEITNIARKANSILGWGTVFGQALNGEHADGIKNMMRAGGVSVDVDKVKDADVEMIYADGETNGNPFAKPETTIFHRGRIRGATQVAFPAFVEAKLAFDNEGVLAADASCACGSDDPLVAAAHTITIPNLPPAWWFDEPTDVQLSGALTITDEGRVYAILAPGKTHHRVLKDRTVPLGNVDYTRFHKGETIVEGGGRVVTGVITADCGHAPTQNYGTLQNRIDHYDNSCSVLANVRLGESRKGYVWAAGALNAGAKPHQVAQALGCALSGDWQPHADRPGLRDFISAHLVPVPGFPLARTQASVQYEDGVLSAASVPVRYIAEPEPLTVQVDFGTVANWKSALAFAIGQDPATRKTQLAREMREM